MDSGEGCSITASVLTLGGELSALGREILKSPGQTLSSVEASRASVTSHQPKVHSVPTFLRERQSGEKLFSLE